MITTVRFQVHILMLGIWGLVRATLYLVNYSRLLFVSGSLSLCTAGGAAAQLHELLLLGVQSKDSQCRARALHLLQAATSQGWGPEVSGTAGRRVQRVGWLPRFV